MVSCFISRLVILIFGTLYPAYASYKAVRTKNVREYVKWMMYWIVFALFTCAETFTDLFLSFWFPFYYEIKIITVIYLLSPATKGSSILYRRFVHPVLTKREQEIDEYIAKAKEQGYHTMLNLGSKGVTYATSLLMQTAIKSGGGLVNQLRKSYSLSDLSEEHNVIRRNADSHDDVDSSYGEDPRLIRKNSVQSPLRPIASPGQAGLYFPEPQGLEEEEYYRKISSSDEISSRYSGGDALYYAAPQPKGDSLVRTASLGPSSRIRTRAAARNGLPKRSALSEGGSSWSAVEPHGIQSETDHHFSFPLSHSASFPFPFPVMLQRSLVPPEYQNSFGSLTQNQMFTFINHPAYSQFLTSKPFENDDREVLERKTSPNSVLEDGLEVSGTESEGSSVVTGDTLPNSVVVCENDRVGNSEEDASPANEGLESREKTAHERSGRYNKKPAPTPPNDENTSKATLTVDEDEGEFFTPNASPKPGRKQATPEDQNCDIEDKDSLEAAKKPKSKNKKGDFNISKKLHMPKMSFSFWHQKGGKHPSETSSLTNVETTARPETGDLEYFIPLKDEELRAEDNSERGELKD